MEKKNGETETLATSPRRSSPTTLYVGDLDASVTEDDLMNAFDGCGRPDSVHLVRKGEFPVIHGYVSFVSEEQALGAMREMNHTVLKGRPMRVMMAHKDLVQTKVLNSANVFVKNLDESVDGKMLEKMFAVFGTVVSCKVAVENGRSKGFGFVQFSKKEEADASILALSGSIVAGNNSKKLYVAKFMNKNERLNTMQGSKFSNLYVKNFHEDLTDDLLREKFSTFGVVQSAVVMKDEAGKSRGFGFVCFQSPEDAKKAIQMMNGTKQGSKILYVSKAQRKHDRERLLKCKFQDKQRLLTASGSGKGSNIFLLNLDGSIGENSLIDIFDGIGQVRSLSSFNDINSLKKGSSFSKSSSREVAAGAKKENKNPLLFPIPSHKNISECDPTSLPNYRPPYMYWYPGINSNRYQPPPPHLQEQAKHYNGNSTEDFQHAQKTYANAKMSKYGNMAKTYSKLPEASSPPDLSCWKTQNQHSFVQKSKENAN